MVIDLIWNQSNCNCNYLNLKIKWQLNLFTFENKVNVILINYIVKVIDKCLLVSKKFSITFENKVIVILINYILKVIDIGLIVSKKCVKCDAEPKNTLIFAIIVD